MTREEKLAYMEVEIQAALTALLHDMRRNVGTALKFVPDKLLDDCESKGQLSYGIFTITRALIRGACFNVVDCIDKTLAAMEGGK